MNLRKTAGVLAAFGLIVGLLGSGVGASFFDQVTGTENIAVGTFSCRIVNPSDGTIAGDLKSVSYDAPAITSSAPGIAPFSFTVQNNGSINQVLTVSKTGQTGNLSGSFSDIPASPPSVTLTPGETQVISTGIQWTALVNDDLGRFGSMTWTVNCGESVGSVINEFGPVAITGAADIGTCNNTWAVDAYDKYYLLTETGTGTYAVQIVYRNGTFVSNAGMSPGACEQTSPPNNGNTVAAGVTGTMHQTWIGTLTATTSPDTTPDCPSFSNCTSATNYLTAVFGSGNFSAPAYSYTGYYNAGSNGAWFDTWTNWPLDDIGDITGS